MSDVCVPYHDFVNAVVTSVLIVGCMISYAPQHYRIISKGSSEGLCPFFLLLGSVGSAANFFNVVTLQWPMVLCCPVLTLGSCLEATAGIFQLGLMTVLFTTTNVLYLMYYPPHLKYTSTSADPEAIESLSPATTTNHLEKSDHWKTSVRLFRAVVGSFIFMTLTTIFLLSSSSPSSAPSPTGTSHMAIPFIRIPFLTIESWATFLGLTSTLLTIVQYIPQIIHTYQFKLVGALSMPMMVLQISGAPLIVWSIGSRPGTDWTSTLPFAVSGLMQTTLLIMCILWTFRQRKLGIDEFGRPLPCALGPGPSETERLMGDIQDAGHYGATADPHDNDVLGRDVVIPMEEEDPAMKTLGGSENV